MSVTPAESHETAQTTSDELSAWESAAEAERDAASAARSCGAIDEIEAAFISVGAASSASDRPESRNAIAAAEVLEQIAGRVRRGELAISLAHGAPLSADPSTVLATVLASLLAAR
ncbi:MAG: hypothetical protein ACT4R6_07945 [Gemmatimonadaceae bacterium]